MLLAGESEANVRKLFEDAEADQKANGDASELHVIIFDEIDAICKQRGSVSSGSGLQHHIGVPVTSDARVSPASFRGGVPAETIHLHLVEPQILVLAVVGVLQAESSSARRA